MALKRLVSLVWMYIQYNVHKNLILKALFHSWPINDTLWFCWDAICYWTGDLNAFTCRISSNRQWELGNKALHHFRLEAREYECNYMFWDSPTTFSYYWCIWIVLVAKGSACVPKPRDTWHYQKMGPVLRTSGKSLHLSRPGFLVWKKGD